MRKPIISKKEYQLFSGLIVFLFLLFNTHLLSMSNLKVDKYDVGFRYYEVFDTTRLYYSNNQDTTYRPLLITFWYPTKEESEKDNMNFKQYIDLISIREDFSKPNDVIDSDSYNFVNAYAQFAQNSYAIGLNITTQEILDSPVKACLNLPIEKGEFPLIIYAPSNSKTPIQNHIICEFLASHGFYVISVPSAGPNSIERKDIGKSILAQVEDMEFILDYIENKIKINYSNIGLLGFSMGGLATAIFQMKHTNVKAIFSMDGSQDYSLYISLSKLKDYDVDKTEVPYFLVGNGSSNSVYPFFNSIKSKEKFFFRMPHLSHFGFVSFWTYFDNCDPDTARHNYSKSYQFICESAVTFFDAKLNQNIKSNNKLLSLNSQENNFAIYEKLDNSESTNLLNTFLQDNIDSAILTYKNHKSINFNNYNYNEEEISALGRTIIDYDLGASEKLFLFNREEYPDSWHVYFDLAFAYKIKGDINLAKEAITKAQEIEPDNNEVKDLLKELENEE
jgi:dienelactone hydrolase